MVTLIDTLFRLVVLAVPISFGVYVVLCLRRITISLQQINETLRRRVG